MLLVEFTINGTLNRLSDVGHALTKYWDAKIVSMDPIQNQLSSFHGGYVRLGYGSISFMPDLFDDDWPPPINGVISVYYSATTEEAKSTLFTGVAHLAGIDRGQVKYELYGCNHTETIANATAYNDTLGTVLNSILTGISEISTLDTTYARVVSPNITYTTSGTILNIELASAIAAFYSHLFYVSGTTAYLIDMFLDGGSTTVTEFDYFPSSYEYLQPISTFRCGSFARFSVYSYGSEKGIDQYHTTEANVNTALDDINTIWHRPRVRLRMPLVAASIVSPGTKISWEDTSLGQDTDMWIRARTIIYDFTNEEIIVEGEGGISAA